MRMKGPAHITQSVMRSLSQSQAGIFSFFERGELLLAASPFLSYNARFVIITISDIKPGIRISQRECTG